MTFEPGIGGVKRLRVHNAEHTTVKQRIGNLNTDLVTVKPGQEATVLRAYRNRPEVRAVGRNFLRTASDPLPAAGTTKGIGLGVGFKAST